MTEGPEARSRLNPESPQNNYFDNQLNKAGIPTSISPELQSKIFTLPNEKLDQLTKLPLETDNMRTAITKRLGEAMKSGERFACFYTDTDNLKTANYVDRDFGDAIIRSDVARIGKMIEEIDLGDSPVYLLRQTGAADETVVWFFGLSEDQQQTLREKSKELNRKRLEVVVTDKKNEQKTFTISTTATIVDSEEPEVQEMIANTLTWMKQGGEKGIDVIPRNDYKEIKRTADDLTKFMKVAKDIARLPVEELGVAESRKKVKEILVDTVADTRVSRPFARAVLSIMEQTTVMDALTHRESREQMYEYLELDQENADRLFTDEDLRVMYFDSMLHKIYEDSGIDTSDL